MKYNDKAILLKKFGCHETNKIVKGHKVGNLWHVFFFGDWHCVPDSDIELLQQEPEEEGK